MLSEMVTGEELRGLIDSLPRGKHVYCQLTYNGYIWHQRWTRAAARQLARRLLSVEQERCECRDEYSCYIEINKHNLYISWQLS